MTRLTTSHVLGRLQEPQERPELHRDCDPARPVTLCPECRRTWDEALAEAGQGTLLPEGEK